MCRDHDMFAGELRVVLALFHFARQGAVADNARFEGKLLLANSDHTLSPPDLALDYRQLYEVERGWRDLKGTLKLRTVSHFREGRIRPHV
jgi:transposase